LEIGKGNRMAKTNRLGALAAVGAATLVAVGLLVLVMLVLELRPAEATFPGQNGKIAYVGWDGHDREIYTIDPGGGHRVQITHNNTKDEAPSYSPVGKKIALSARQGKEWEIYTINATGGNRFNLTKNTTPDRWPSYSPSGKKIAYSARGGNDFDIFDFDIFTINVGGGSKFNVTNGRPAPTLKNPDGSTSRTPPHDFSPTYSPDGKKIAFVGTASFESSAIFTTNVGGGGIRRFNGSQVVASPDYSPDGKKIAYINRFQIETINATGGGRSVVLKGRTQVLSASYSPDGKKIAYAGWDGHDSEIYTIPVSGGKPVQLTNNSMDDTSPSWGSR
jgi:TolB protein